MSRDQVIAEWLAKEANAIASRFKDPVKVAIVIWQPQRSEDAYIVHHDIDVELADVAKVIDYCLNDPKRCNVKT